MSRSVLFSLYIQSPALCLAPIRYKRVSVDRMAGEVGETVPAAPKGEGAAFEEGLRSIPMGLSHPQM